MTSMNKKLNVSGYININKSPQIHKNGYLENSFDNLI